MAQIRKAAWAGQFYPAEPGLLRSQIQQFLDASDVDTSGKPMGLVVPHAGYIYSGQTAAAGYKTLLGRDIRTAIVISPSHAAVVRGISVYNGDAYETPLGVVPVNVELAQNIASFDEKIHYSSEGHEPGGHRAEHALEVQLPFLQVVLQDFDIVPVTFHDYTVENCLAIGTAIAKNVSPDHSVVIASSDLYHGYSYEECKRMDDLTISAVLSMDVESFIEGNLAGEYQACGAGPIGAMLTAAKSWGGDTVRLLAQTNSADVTGLRGDWTVGYASLAVY